MGPAFNCSIPVKIMKQRLSSERLLRFACSEKLLNSVCFITEF